MKTILKTILTFLTSDKGKGQLRTGLSFVGGMLVARGISAEWLDAIVNNLDSLTAGVGAVVTVVASIWSATSKKKVSAEETKPS